MSQESASDDLPPMTPLPVVVPSWVMPGSPAANAVWLRGRALGVMLCCFEHAPRLPMELPADSSGLRWHVHLPTDLPWEQGGAAAGAAACRIMAGAAHLLDAASLAILHCPPLPSLLAGFLAAWRGAGHDSRMLLLENPPPRLPEDSGGELEAAPGASDLRLCLDAAHLALSCPPARAAERVTDLAPRVAMIHWSAAKAGQAVDAALWQDAHAALWQDAHAPLTALDAAGKKLYRHIAASIPNAVDVIEVFDWDGVLASWELLRDWRGAAGGEPCLACKTGR